MNTTQHAHDRDKQGWDADSDAISRVGQRSAAPGNAARERMQPSRFDRQQFDTLRTIVDEIPRAESSVHGRQHWMHEAWTGLELADRDTRVDRALVLMFAMIHDTQRQNEDHDPEHGQRAADFARTINHSILKLPPEKLDLLTGACDIHDRGMVTTEPTVGACWDADRLQLPRVGIRPHPRYLSTTAAPLLIDVTKLFLRRSLTWGDVYQRYDQL